MQNKRMSNEEYKKQIIETINQIDDFKSLKTILRFVKRILFILKGRL